MLQIGDYAIITNPGCNYSGFSRFDLFHVYKNVEREYVDRFGALFGSKNKKCQILDIGTIPDSPIRYCLITVEDKHGLYIIGEDGLSPDASALSCQEVGDIAADDFLAVLLM